MKEIKEERWVPAKYIFESGITLEFPKYEVSDIGRVRSLNYHRTGKAKVLKQHAFECIDGTIYYQIQLRLNNKRHLLSVHRLVLSSFKDKEYFPNAVVDHINARTTNSCDNRLSNLHWFTLRQNVSTEQCKMLKSKAMTNHPAKSKRVRVTDLSTGETTEFPSAKEAGRSLGINPAQPAMRINQCKGYYKKLNLLFEYIE